MASPPFTDSRLRCLWANACWIDPESARKRNGSILTGYGKIIGIGEETELETRFGKPERRADLAGRWLLPGLTDAHCHLVSYGVEATRSADLTGCDSLEELLHRLKRHADAYPGEWVLGRGFDQE